MPMYTFHATDPHIPSIAATQSVGGHAMPRLTSSSPRQNESDFSYYDLVDARKRH